jgi:hypothetical protein
MTDEWREGKSMAGTDRTNAWVFTAVWLFDPAGGGNGSAKVAEAPAAGGGSEK